MFTSIAYFGIVAILKFTILNYMHFTKKIRRSLGLSIYRLKRELQAMGVRITEAMLGRYEHNKPTKMKLELLVAFKNMSGMSWEDFGKLLDQEFTPKKGNK